MKRVLSTFTRTSNEPVLSNSKHGAGAYSSFETHFQNLQRNDGFDQEYAQAKNESDYSPGYRERFTVSTMEISNRNRYSNIVCIEESRVKLLDHNGCDYINASHVKGPEFEGSYDYISCQAPLESTIEDFWNMCIQEEVPVVVMLTPFMEVSRHGCRKKACPYFPSDQGEVHVYGKYELTCVSAVEVFPSCELRCFNICKEGESAQTLYHIHFTGWPDFGEVDNYSVIKQLITLLDSCRKENKDRSGPITVHCSAGVGRTGTFIAIDIIRQNFQHAEASGTVYEVNVPSIVAGLRNQRPKLVMTLGQYTMIYHVIHYLLNEGDITEYGGEANDTDLLDDAKYYEELNGTVDMGTVD